MNITGNFQVHPASCFWGILCKTTCVHVMVVLKMLTTVSVVRPLGITIAFTAWESCSRMDQRSYFVYILCIVLYSSIRGRLAAALPGIMQQAHAEHSRINIQIDQILSHNSFLLWWEHCHRAQVAVLLFDEHDNYFSHMPRFSKAPDRNQTSGGNGVEPRTLCATDKPSLLTFYLFIICSFISRCLPFFFFIFLIFAIPSTPPTPHSWLPLSPPTPTRIPLTWLCRAGVGESVTMETGAETVEGSLWQKGGRDEEKESDKDCELGSAVESTSGHPTQSCLEIREETHFIQQSVAESTAGWGLFQAQHFPKARSASLLFSISIFKSILFTASFHWDCGKALSDVETWSELPMMLNLSPFCTNKQPVWTDHNRKTLFDKSLQSV